MATKPNPIAALRKVFGFTRDPEDLGDGGMAFVGFLNFASADSEQARHLQVAYFNDTGKRPHNDKRAEPAEVGHYIDWLIEKHWGEAPRVEH